MRPLLRTLITFSAASVALSACTEQRSSEPTAPGSLRPSFAFTALPAVCDINALRTYARAYFAKTNDPIFKVLNDLSKLTDPALKTDKAFDGLSHVAAARATTRQLSTATGEVFDSLVKGLFGCMEAYVRDAAPTTVDFAPYFPTGTLFEVRGGSADPAGGAYQRKNTGGNPYWGVEAPGSGWATLLAGSGYSRILVYGLPNAAFLNTNGRVGSGFDVHTIPIIGTDQDEAPITVNVGLCNILFETGAFPGNRRLNHDNEYEEYLALGCQRPPELAAASEQPSLLNPRALAQRAIDFFGPQPLHAAVALGIVGGGVGELSPFAVYDLSAVQLGSLGFILDGNNTSRLRVSTAISGYGDSLVVQATSAGGGAPLEGVPIQMSIQGNSSNIAFFGVPNGTATDTVVTVTRITKPDGYANFGDVRLLKAGGYIVNFRVFFVDPFGDVAGPVLPSNPFNIQNK